MIDDWSTLILTSTWYSQFILHFTDTQFRYRWSLISVNIFTDNFWYRQCFNSAFSEYCVYRCWYCRPAVMAVCRMLVSAAPLNDEPPQLWWLWTRFRLILKQHWKQLHQTYRRGCVRFCACLYCCVVFISTELYLQSIIAWHRPATGHVIASWADPASTSQHPQSQLTASWALDN